MFQSVDGFMTLLKGKSNKGFRLNDIVHTR